MTKDEAMKLALEALKASDILVDCFDIESVNKQTDEAITALRQALEQPAQEPVWSADEMRSALRVIHTWASVPGALDARHVLELTAKALHMPSNV